MLSLEDTFYAIEMTLDIEVAKANRDFRYESGIARIEGYEDAYYSMMMEATKQSEPESSEPAERTSKKPGLVSRIMAAVKKFIQDLKIAIDSAFRNSDKEEINVDSFLDSKTGQMTVDYDMEQISRDVDKKILEGRKIVQKISSVTGIDDASVARFVDSCNEVVPAVASIVIPAKLYGKSRNFVRNKALHNVQNQCDEFTRDAEEGENDSRRAAQKGKVANAISHMVQSAGGARRKVASQFLTFEKNQSQQTS